MDITAERINELRKQIGVGWSVAKELLTLAGGDIEMAMIASRQSDGLDQCKAKIINERFSRLEK